MPTTSPILGLPMADQDADFVTDYPDAVDIPRTTNLEKFTVPRFASITERNTKIPAPVAGQLCYLTDTGTMQRYYGSAWIGDTAWTNATLLNSWQAYDAQRQPQFKQDFTGEVHIQGVLKHTTTPPPAVAFVIPAQYRSATQYSLHFITTATSGVATVDVLNNGNIQVGVISPATATFVSIAINYYP